MLYYFLNHISYYDIYRSYIITIKFDDNIFKLILINDDSYKNNLLKNIRSLKKIICILLNTDFFTNVYNINCKKLNNNMVLKYSYIMNSSEYNYSVSLYSSINKKNTYYHNIMNIGNFNETLIKYFSYNTDNECYADDEYDNYCQ